MPNSTIVGYARVSSVDQNLDRQLVQLKAENVEKLFIDKVSGKNLDRPGFSAMMEYVREGECVGVCNDNVLRLPGHVTSSITVRPEN